VCPALEEGQRTCPEPKGQGTCCHELEEGQGPCHETEGFSGVGAHSDSGMITLLVQDHHGGLEAQLPGGTWVRVPPRAGMLVVNLGEMLQVVTRTPNSESRIPNPKPQTPNSKPPNPQTPDPQRPNAAGGNQRLLPRNGPPRCQHPGPDPALVPLLLQRLARLPDAPHRLFRRPLRPPLPPCVGEGGGITRRARMACGQERHVGNLWR
jgi:hypothetical protein